MEIEWWRQTDVKNWMISNELWVMSDEWWVMSDGNWVTKIEWSNFVTQTGSKILTKQKCPSSKISIHKEEFEWATLKLQKSWSIEKSLTTINYGDLLISGPPKEKKEKIDCYTNLTKVLKNIVSLPLWDRHLKSNCITWKKKILKNYKNMIY